MPAADLLGVLIDQLVDALRPLGDPGPHRTGRHLKVKVLHMRDVRARQVHRRLIQRRTLAAKGAAAVLRIRSPEQVLGRSGLRPFQRARSANPAMAHALQQDPSQWPPPAQHRPRTSPRECGSARGRQHPEPGRRRPHPQRPGLAALPRQSSAPRSSPRATCPITTDQLMLGNRSASIGHKGQRLLSLGERGRWRSLDRLHPLVVLPREGWSEGA